MGFQCRKERVKQTFPNFSDSSLEKQLVCIRSLRSSSTPKYSVPPFLRILRKYPKCVKNFMVKNNIARLSVMIQMYNHLKYQNNTEKPYKLHCWWFYHTVDGIAESLIFSALKDNNRVCLHGQTPRAVATGLKLYLFTSACLKNTNFLVCRYIKKKLESILH